MNLYYNFLNLYARCGRRRLAQVVALGNGGYVAGGHSPVVSGGDDPDDHDVGDPVTNVQVMAVNGRCTTRKKSQSTAKFS